MPVAPLAAQTIGSRVGEILLELGNRADLNSGSPSRISIWIRNAYVNLCMNYDFEGLEFTLDSQVSNTDTLAWPAQARAIKSMIITDSSGTVTYPDQVDIATIRRMNAANNPGKASKYTIFGNNIKFAPAFDAGVYDVTMDLWQRPMLDTTTLNNTPLLLPDDWFEALDYMAEMRGHIALGEVDKAVAIQKTLYGYTDPSTAQHVPGMLYNLQMRRQANAPARDYGLQPRSQRIKYT